MSLVKELIKGLLPEEEGKKSIGVFGGGFKPPTKGHFEVLKKALDENPEIDEMLVFIGKGERDGITQEESLKIWEIYGRYLPFKVQYIKSTKPPIQLIYNTAKENPESEVLWIIGAREENEDDFKDIASRTSGITKYPNLELRTIVTKGGVSGTAARNAAKVSKEKLDDFLPEFLSEKEKQDIFVMLSNTVTENDPEDGKAAPYGSGYNSINENASYSQHIDIKKEIGNLIKHMLDNGMNIQPLPKLVFKNGDSENAKQFLGKTAYYDPNSMSIVLYTEGRHPKDIVRSFSHEMVHHTQNLEGRLGDVSTTNTMEDDHLDKLEQEANLTGTMTFRNWTDSLNENLTKSSNYLYHWTSYSACKNILEFNKLKSNKSNQFFEYDESRDLPDYKNVVFFTVENERFADEENSNQCILVVDKSKLSKDYKVISYGNPYEETVVYTNDPSISVLPYLKGVILMNTLQKSAVKKMEEFLESKGIPYEINDKLEREVKAKQAKLPTLKKELINKLKLKYPNGFIGYLNKPLFSYQTPEYFKNNSTYSYPNITINKPGEYGKKNKFQVKFKIESQNLEKYINWYMYSPDSIEDLINMDNYEGENLWLKGDIPINSTTLQEANLTGTMTFRNWTDSLNESFYLDIPKFSQPKTLQHYLIENINEISLSKENTVDINGDLTGGTFTVGDITYEYSIKNIPNPYKDLGLFYNIQFTPSGEVTSIPKGGKENYIKILSTIYKIIVDFIEKEKPEYVGISSLDNSGDKNYHTVYNRLTTNNLNLIPGYFRKDSNLTFDSPQGKGRFIVLKKKDDLNEKKTKDPFGINAYAMELGRLREEETEYKIYVDMDGVVADFDQRFRDLAGIGPREFEEKYGKNAFWDFIDEGDNKLVFWVGIPPMSDAKQLIDYVSKYDYEMLTAPSLKKQSLMGKGLWMKNQTNKGLFPSKPKVNYRSAKSKKDFAAPNHILIDDREDTINSWNAAGGIGILHTSAANTINQLKKLGL